MVDVSGPPLWEPDTETVMEVGVDGAPPLNRTALVVHPELTDGVWDLSKLEDEVNGSFPDGDSGTIAGHYILAQPFGRGLVQGSVDYVTDAAENPFNGASVVSIAIVVALRPIEIRDQGYEWFAAAGATIEDPAVRIGGLVGSGGRLTFTATLNLEDDPPSFSFS